MPVRQRSGDLDVARLFAFGAAGDVEADALALGQALEVLRLNCREVCEKVFAALFGRNEAEAFCIVKPFDGTCCHILNLRVNGAEPLGGARVKTAR